MTDAATDLFGGAYPDPPTPEPMPGDSPCVRRTKRQKADVARGVHPLTGGPLRDGSETCGTCRHRIQVGGLVHAKSYPKCDLVPITSGAATDVRAWWPACVRWKVPS